MGFDLRPVNTWEGTSFLEMEFAHVGLETQSYNLDQAGLDLTTFNSLAVCPTQPPKPQDCRFVLYAWPKLIKKRNEMAEIAEDIIMIKSEFRI